MKFTLHPQLQADCHTLGESANSTLLLHKNALVPWFILVPHTEQNEIYKLGEKQRLNVQSITNKLSAFVEQHYNTDKLNIATIGNIVPQLHIHIIGRFKTDFCWPNPVWGQTDSAQYATSEIENITQQLRALSLVE